MTSAAATAASLAFTAGFMAWETGKALHRVGKNAERHILAARNLVITTEGDAHVFAIQLPCGNQVVFTTSGDVYINSDRLRSFNFKKFSPDPDSFRNVGCRRAKMFICWRHHRYNKPGDANRIDGLWIGARGYVFVHTNNMVHVAEIKGNSDPGITDDQYLTSIWGAFHYGDVENPDVETSNVIKYQGCTAHFRAK